VHKLILIFHSIDDSDVFERRWSEEFVPLAEQLPGLQRVAISRVQQQLGEGRGARLIHELFFEDRHALEAGMQSPVGERAGRKLIEIAGDSVEVLTAEHAEDIPRPPQ
jgi:uncharacterized protein (TIGR02118 family)